jgi:hypothetical protein
MKNNLTISIFVITLCLYGILTLSACQNVDAVHASVAPTVPRNFVCERVAIKNPTAKCDPEYTDVGELHTYTARITIGDSTVSCGLNSNSLAIACGDLFVTPQAPPPTPAAPKK